MTVSKVKTLCSCAFSVYNNAISNSTLIWANFLHVCADG